MTSFADRAGDAVGDWKMGGLGGELSSSDSHIKRTSSFLHHPSFLLLLTPTFTNFLLPTPPFLQLNPKPTRSTSRLSLHHPSFFICTGISHPSRTVFGPNLHVVMDGSSVRRMNVGRRSSPTTLSLLSTFTKSRRNGRIFRCFLNRLANLYVLT